MKVQRVVLAGMGARCEAISPGTDWCPGFAVSMPSEKLEPSGPGSVRAEPDCPATREFSHTETVNEWVVSITGPAVVAICPAAAKDSAVEDRPCRRGPAVQPAPPARLSEACWGLESAAVDPCPSAKRQVPLLPGISFGGCGASAADLCELDTRPWFRASSKGSGSVETTRS